MLKTLTDVYLDFKTSAFDKGAEKAKSVKEQSRTLEEQLQPLKEILRTVQPLLEVVKDTKQ